MSVKAPRYDRSSSNVNTQRNRVRTVKPGGVGGGGGTGERNERKDTSVSLKEKKKKKTETLSRAVRDVSMLAVRRLYCSCEPRSLPAKRDTDGEQRVG